jgi:hypothetical protein
MTFELEGTSVAQFITAEADVIELAVMPVIAGGLLIPGAA